MGFYYYNKQAKEIKHGLGLILINTRAYISETLNITCVTNASNLIIIENNG